MKKKKIFIQLIGGLGNQLFQYSCAKNLSIITNGELNIDDKTYMSFDKIFKRKAELPKNLGYKKIPLINKIIFLILILIKKTLFKKKIFITLLNTILIDETISFNKFLNLKKITNRYKNIYLVGFFQNEKYFSQNKNFILNRILENKIVNLKVKKILKKIKKNTVMIGARFFEEVPKNIKHNFGKIENLHFYLKSIKNFKIKNKKKFLLFTTIDKNSKVLIPLRDLAKIFDQNCLKKSNSLENLLLFSNFKNFIISNSTFYWWGAYMSEYKNKKVNILCSTNFLSKDLFLKRWKNNKFI